MVKCYFEKRYKKTGSNYEGFPSTVTRNIALEGFLGRLAFPWEFCYISLHAGSKPGLVCR